MPRSLHKFRVLELIARVPYQAWEQVAYIKITHAAEHCGLARRIYERVEEARAQQDNEQMREPRLRGLGSRNEHVASKQR
jgi:metal-sulfur cluster biosynthetic enzyme